MTKKNQIFNMEIFFEFPIHITTLFWVISTNWVSVVIYKFLKIELLYNIKHCLSYASLKRTTVYVEIKFKCMHKTELSEIHTHNNHRP